MSDPSTDQVPDPTAIYIDGVPYTIDDLSYREHREMRSIVQGLVPSDGDISADPADAAEADFIPAVITVIKRRTDPDFSVDQALEFRPKDLEPPVPPTKTAAKKRAARTK